MTLPPLTPAMGEFGRRVRERRRALGLSQEALVASSKLTASNLGKIERGRLSVGFAGILRLANLLEIDPGELMRGLKHDGER